MKKFWLVIGFVFTGIVFSNAQQRFQLTHYMVNPFVFNPALAGTNEYVDIKAGFRTQWTQLEHHPVTYYASAHSPFMKGGGKPNEDENSGYQGIGGYIFNDVTGPTSRAEVAGAYSYNTPLFQNFRLSMGAFAGLQQYKIDGNMLDFHDPEEVGVLTRFVPNISLGTWFYNPNMYFGFSVNQLLQNRLNFDIYNENVANEREYSKLTNHYFAMAGYRIPISGTPFTVVPSVFSKYQSSSPISVDVNAKISYGDRFGEKFWGGLTYRGGDALSAVAGFIYDQTWEFAYSYDLTTSGLGPHNNGTHEITVGYRHPFKRKVVCPQNFW